MNHPGEIAPLARLVAPHVALITTVAGVHAEAFADEAAIADEKAAIFDGLVRGGVAVIPADNPHAARLSTHANALGVRLLRFGAAGQEARLLSVIEAVDHVMVTAEILGMTCQFRVGAPGGHWAQNALAILLALAAIDVDLVHGFTALETYRPLAGRGAVTNVPVADGQVTLIDDSYNANPTSMRAALATLAHYPGRRIAVLTDMLELGASTEAEHRALAEPILAAGVDAVFCAGPAMRALFDALPKSRQASWRDRVDDLVSDIKTVLKNGDVVLVKGSNGSRAGAIVAALTVHEGECVDVV